MTDDLDRLAAKFSTRPAPATSGDDYPSDWPTRRERVFERDGYTCQECGMTGGEHGPATLHPDHIVPVGEDGSHAVGNLETKCARCHSERHGNPTIARFRSR